VTQDVLQHGPGDQGVVAAIGLPQQQGLGGRLGGQGQGGEGVHDQVHPQHLHRFQGRVLEKAGYGVEMRGGLIARVTKARFCLMPHF